MSEPRRLLSGDSGATALERRLLGAGRQRREPGGMRDRVLAGVGAVVATGAIASTSAATAKTAAASGATTKATLTGAALAHAKLVILSAALVTAAAATTTYVAMSAAPKPAPAVATTTLPPAPTVIAPSAAPSPQPIEPAPKATAPPRAPVAARSPSVSQSELREEAALVDEARAALAAGDLGTASDRLARADARFPRGRLAEEREALAVRIASAAGDGVRASKLARAFLARHPTSPLRPSMESIAKKNEIE